LCSAPETSRFHYQAWQQATEHLQCRLRAAGCELHIVLGEVVDVLEHIRSIEGFDALFSHEETGSAITFARDQHVARWVSDHRIAWHQSPQKPLDCLSHCTLRSWPDFATFSKNPSKPQSVPDTVQTIDEDNAHRVLDSFLSERGVAYSGGISSPNTAFTAGSRLSAHLAWGTMSLRQVFHACRQRDSELARCSSTTSKQWRKSLKAFQSRLHWHDHFIQRLESAPAMEHEALNPAFRTISYGDNEQLLDAWIEGRTGLPLVDACMRCLAETGFLNFRMRAMIVSVACFGLAQSWRSIQYPLARLFLDYEPGIHFSQIQMQAGIVGINTLRVYNPQKQLLDQDPQAIFVKRWVPELREFNALDISEYNSRSLGDYPHPITDISHNTRIIRDQIYAIRKSDAGREASAKVLIDHGSRLPGNDRPIILIVLHPQGLGRENE